MAESVADRLKEVRGNMRQPAFAAQLGVDKNTVGRYERGERQPEFSYLQALAREFGVNLHWLATGEGPMYHEPAASPEALAGLQAVRPDFDPVAATRAVAATPNTAAASGMAPAAPLDEDLLGRCFDGIKRTYREAGGRIDDLSAGRVAARLYADVLAACEGEPSAQRAALNMGLAQLRRDVSASPSDAERGKHSA